MKTVTICASAAFYKEVLEIEKALKKLGFIVLVPITARRMQRSGNFDVDTHKNWFQDPKFYKEKTKLMNLHFKKVAEGDIVLVINNEKRGIAGYIGGNVLMEMALGHYLKKKIYLWNEIGEGLAYEEEIKGMKPTIINQNLTLIR